MRHDEHRLAGRVGAPVMDTNSIGDDVLFGPCVRRADAAAALKDAARSSVRAVANMGTRLLSRYSKTLLRGSMKSQQIAPRKNNPDMM